MSDSRDTNRDGHVSLMEKVKDKLHLGGHHKDTSSDFTSSSHHSTTTASSHHTGLNSGSHTTGIAAMPVAAMPIAGVMPLAGAKPLATDSRDLNRDGHISASERLQSATGATGAFNDSRDLNRDGHISTSEKLKSSTGNYAGGAFDSRDLNRDGHISTSEQLASRTGFKETEEARLKLHEEQLAVSKREVGAGEVGIHKRVEQERVQETIPVRREEVTVERRPLSGIAEPGARIAEQDEILRVPLYREEIVTEKRLVPTEEVIVRKKEVIENEVVGATLRSEYVETTQTATQTGFDARDKNRDGHVSMGEKLSSNTGANMGAFDARDKNRDGHVSMGEKLSSTGFTGALDARDTNRDGHVSMGEKLKGSAGSTAGAFDARDSNRDGHISMGEKLKGGAANFAAPKAARG